MTTLHEHVRRLTSKGQVTVPIEIRKQLGIKPGEKVVFRVLDDRVELAAAPMNLADAFGSVQPLQRPEDFEALRETALAEHSDKVLREMGED